MNIRSALLALWCLGMAMVTCPAQTDNPLRTLKSLTEEPGANREQDQERDREKDLSGVKEVQVPAVFGFDGQLSVAQTSARRVGDSNRVDEFDHQNKLVRTAIISDQGNSVSVKITRHFTNQQDLLDELPGLDEHARSFPKQSNGLDLEMNVGVTRTFRADSMDHFARKYPDIHRQYRQQMGSLAGNGAGFIRRGGGATGGRDFPLPEIRGTVIRDRTMQRVQGLNDQIGNQIDTAQTQLDALNRQRNSQVERLGEGHAAIQTLDRAIENTEATISDLRKKMDGLRKTIDLRMKDLETLQNFPKPEIKKTVIDK